MKGQSSKKTWIISIGIILAAVLAYYTFFANTPDLSFSGSLEAEDTGEILGAEVLSLFNQVQQLTIDTAFFTHPAYRSLQDYTVVIPPQEVGRPNPFAPLSGVRRQER